MKKRKEAKIILFFWCIYTAVSLLKQGDIIEFVISQLIGITIVAIYLSFTLIFKALKKKKPVKEEPKEKEDKALIAFRFLFSKDLQEAQK